MQLGMQLSMQLSMQLDELNERRRGPGRLGIAPFTQDPFGFGGISGGRQVCDALAVGDSLAWICPSAQEQSDRAGVAVCRRHVQWL